MALLAIADFFSEWNGTALLYSGGDFDSAKYSFLSLFPFESVSVRGSRLEHRLGRFSQVFAIENPWDGLQEHFFSSLSQDPSSMAFGWFGYGMGAFADGDIALPYRPSRIPDAYWQRSALTVCVESGTQNTSVRINGRSFDSLLSEEREWAEDCPPKRGGKVSSHRSFCQKLRIRLLLLIQRS